MINRICFVGLIHTENNILQTTGCGFKLDQVWATSWRDDSIFIFQLCTQNKTWSVVNFHILVLF